MYRLRRKLFSQNFLHNRALVSNLVRASSINKKDLVLEIGPGKGIITEQLLKAAQYVIAVEIDTYWYNYLKEKFEQVENLTLYNYDFLNFNLPALPYKTFANIPFAIEGQIIRKLIDAPNPPKDCYLVMMKELAYRLSAPYKDNQFSIMHKPWLEFSIVHHFQAKDFIPIPNVKAVLLKISQRKEPLLPFSEKKLYHKFIKTGFKFGLPVSKNLKKVYGYKATLKGLIKANAQRNDKPGYLKLNQWLKLYQELKTLN